MMMYLTILLSTIAAGLAFSSGRLWRASILLGLQGELDATRERLAGAEPREALASARHERDAALEAVKACEATLTRRAAERDALSVEINAQREALRGFKDTAEVLRVDLSHTRLRYEACSFELSEARSMSEAHLIELSEVRSMLEAARAQIEAMTSRLQSAEATAKAARARVDVLTRRGAQEQTTQASERRALEQKQAARLTELSQARAALAEAREALKEDKARALTLSAALESERRASEQRQATLLERERRLSAVEAERDQLHQRSDELSKEREALLDENRRLAEAPTTIKQLQASLHGAERALQEAKVQLHVFEERSRGLDRLQAALDHKHAELEVTRQESVSWEVYAAMEQEKRGLAVARSLLAQQVDGLKAHADENALLRERLEVAMARAEQLPGVERRLADAEARLFAQGASVDKPAMTRSPTTADEPTAMADGETTGTMMDAALSSLVVEGGSRVVTVSDHQGLLVAASGDPAYQHELAATASLLQQIGEQARALLPLGALKSVELADINDTHLQARFFESGAETMTLSMLGGVAHGDATVAQVASTIPQLLGAD